MQILTPEEAARWEDIRKTFRKNQLLRGGDERDPVTQVVRQLAACFEGIDSIKEVLSLGLADNKPAAPITLIVAAPNGNGAGSETKRDGHDGLPSGIRELKIDQETLEEIWRVIEKKRLEANGGDSAEAPANSLK